MTEQEIYLSAKFAPDGRVYEMSATVGVPTEAATDMFLTMAARALVRAAQQPSPRTGDTGSLARPYVETSVSAAPRRPAPDPLNADTKIEDLWASRGR